MVKAVVGANWGDEGKGKITDMLAEKADIIVRFQGGANAGHTIVNNYGKFALHTLPSGVFYDHTTSVIGNGVALNIPVFFKEYNDVVSRGVPAPKILISERAQMVMPYHILFDQYEEERLGGKSFGSTKSGIAPFYSDKYAKIGFQVSELFDEEYLKEKLASVCATKNVLLEHLYHKPLLNVDELFAELMEYKKMVEPYVCDVSLYLWNALKEGKEVLLEGQLGSLKDPDHGIYPMVTSSSTLAGYGAVGAGLPPYEIKQIVTVCKAYSSAVGAGAFVSEIFGDEADELRRRGGDGGEFGATTGRPRRMGWFDCVASKYGCRLQGTTDVAFTVLDVLGYLDEIPVCTGYEIDGKVTTEFPTTTLLEKAKPVLETLPGWKCDIRGIKKYEDLPENCRKYVEFVEKHIGFPITMISNGPEQKFYIKMGTVLHSLFSTIRTRDDIEGALKQLELDGVLYDENISRDRVEKMIRKRLESDKVSDWFSDRWNVFNECSIISTDKDGNMVEHRPDRVMKDEHETVVVDFKFGKPKPEYHDQIKGYMKLLESMGHAHVKGYLWYVYPNKIEEVL